MTGYRSDQSRPAAERPEIIIAVMGETGAGKSRFINEAIGSDVAGVGHSLRSGTSKLVNQSVNANLSQRQRISKHIL
jgi:predicted GTPase